MDAPCTDHLFLTGDKGVGKSTLARCLLAGHTPCGFRTVRVTGVLDRPSVHLLPAVGGVPSAENLLFYCGAYSCDRFDTLGTAALRDRDGDVLLMDELGPAESGAKNSAKRCSRPWTVTFQFWVFCKKQIRNFSGRWPVIPGCVW